MLDHDESFLVSSVVLGAEVWTITGTRLHVLSLTDVLCTHVGTLQVISL